jgi:hypothetical protein
MNDARIVVAERSALAMNTSRNAIALSQPSWPEREKRSSRSSLNDKMLAQHPLFSCSPGDTYAFAILD